MPFSGIEEQVTEAWDLCSSNQAKAVKMQKRKARLRFARRGALATICLLIGICVFSVLDPISVSTAGSFISQAQNWIGGVFYPNDAKGMPPPPPSDFLSHEEETPIERRDFKSIEEIQAAYGVTVYEPTLLTGSMKPGNVEAIVSDGCLVSLRYRYEADEKRAVVITIQPSDETPDVDFPEDSFLHTAPVGEFNVHKAVSGGWLANTYTGGSVVSIVGKMEKDDFLALLDTLRTVQ